MSKQLYVLYVDDEPLLKMAFVETLNQHGYCSRGAESGQEALDMIKEDTPDIIILDIMMKPMDGWETLARIRENENWRVIPVIMQTGKSLTIRDVLKYGDLIDDYMIKPVRLPDLIRSIEGVQTMYNLINREYSTAIENGADPILAEELRRLEKKVMVDKRLIEVLGRIYPIKKDGTIETDIEIPELYEFVHRFEKARERRTALLNSLIPKNNA